MQTVGTAAGVVSRKKEDLSKRRQARKLLLVRIGLIVTSFYLFGYYAFHNGLDRSLIAAIERGDVEGAKFALKWGANPNTRNSHRQPALLLTLIVSPDEIDKDSRRTQLAAALLEHGADPKIMDRSGGTSLLRLAVASGYASVARLLMARGAEIAGDEGAASLRAAAARGYNDLVVLLLDAGVHVDAVREDSSGETPLMTAALRHNPTIVQTLLERGADVNRRNAFGVTALMFAVMDFPAVSDSLTLLSPARKAEKQAITRLLLQHGADIRLRDRYKNSALNYALAKANNGTVITMRGSDNPAQMRKLDVLVNLLQEAEATPTPAF